MSPDFPIAPPRSLNRWLPLCALVASGIHAQESSGGTPSEVFQLGVVEVTGLREAAAQGNPAIIPHTELRTFERDDLSSALSLAPGVVQSAVGPRNEGTAHIRGFDLRQTPVFTDGVPVYVPYDGYVDLNRFSTFDTARIDVDKGFSSATLGPNTLGGAVNVISRRPEAPLEGSLLLGWSEGNSYRSALNLGTRQEFWYSQFSFSYVESDSFRLSDDFVPTATEDGDRRDHARRTDWRASAKIGYTPNATDEYAIGYVLQRGEKENPVYTGLDPTVSIRYWDWPQWDKQTVYFVSSTNLGDHLYLKPRIYFDQFQNTLASYDDDTYSTQLKRSAFTSIYDDYTVGGSIEIGTLNSGAHALKAALHVKYDHHDEHDIGSPHSVYEDLTWSLGLEDAMRLADEWELIVGGSYDIREPRKAWHADTQSDLGGERHDSFNPQVGLFYRPADDQTLRATVARKSRFPTIKDRYSYRMGSALPNPDLEPESALHYELGYDGRLHETLRVNASLFLAEVTDTIQRVDNVQPGVYQLRNVGDSRHLGAEAGFVYQPDDAFLIGVNYSYLDRQNRSQPDIRLTDTPRHHLRAWSEIQPLPWLRVIPEFEYTASRYSTSAGFKAQPFAVTNLKFSFALPGVERLTLDAGVQNLFDRNYDIAEGYPMPGRTFFTNLTWEF